MAWEGVGKIGAKRRAFGASTMMVLTPWGRGVLFFGWVPKFFLSVTLGHLMVVVGLGPGR